MLKVFHFILSSDSGEYNYTLYGFSDKDKAIRFIKREQCCPDSAILKVYQIFTYFINMDERGEFKADIRDELGQTIMEIDNSIFTDGFMRHKNDMGGLFTYAVSLGILSKNDMLIEG